MFLTIICAETGSGKSTIAKEYVKRSKNACVLDLQEEYELQPLSKFNKDKFYIHPSEYSLEDFVSMTAKMNKYTIVAEESTGVIDNYFFNSKLGKKFIQTVLSKRHNGKNNDYVFLFHTVNSVPPILMGFCDYLYLFRTGDLDRTINSKYPELYNDWRSIINSQEKKQVPWGDWKINDFKLILKSNLAKQNPDYPINF